MSYVEDAIYGFIKDIFTKGILVLTNKRFLLYTSIAVIMPVILTILSFFQGSEFGTVYNFLFNLELAACVALVITGLVSLKIQLIKVEHLLFLTLTGLLLAVKTFWDTTIVDLTETIFVYISFYSWIITTNIAGLMAIREFMVTWPGWVIRLGDKEERLTFGPLVKLGLFATLAWFTYSIFFSFSWSYLLAFFAAGIVFYTIYVFMPLTKDSIMSSIICFFYFMLLYHLFVRAESSTGFLVLDILLIVGTTIFTAQSISRLIASKKYALPYQWDSLIILLMGFMLGYHLLGVRIAFFGGMASLYSLYHDIAFGFGTLTIFGILILYLSNKSFRGFSKPKVKLMDAVKRVSGMGLEAVTDYAKGLTKTLKKKQWQIEIKKNKDEEE